MPLAPQKKSVKTSTLTCYHCGSDCVSEHVRFEEHDFCCEGCKLVYSILNEHKLCSYYDLNEQSGISPEHIQEGKFAYLDDAEVIASLTQFTEGAFSKVTFYIPGMHCSSCIWLLENLNRLDSGVNTCLVNFPQKEATILFRNDETSLRKIATILAKIGYEPHISLEDIDSRKTNKKDRSSWYKIGLAGFCFGNIMMLSFPEYFSIGAAADNASLQRLFSYLNLGLAIPVLLYSSREFFESALGALRARYLNIDLPIAAAILMTFLRSVYEILSQTGPGYLDSMTGIVFFMLIGRVFQTRTFAHLSFERDYKSYFPVAVGVLNGELSEQLPVTKLKKGMIMRIRHGEIIPADALLLDDLAQIDYSFVTGESELIKKQKGEIIYAGGRHNGAAIRLEIVKPVKYSYLTQLWNNPGFQKNTLDRERQSMVSHINQWFTGIVFAIAFITSVYWLMQDQPTRMMDAATTILIVACPCILLLAANFTHGNVLRILGKNHFYLKNAFVLDSIKKADTLVFDKTGTITSSGGTSIEWHGEALSEEEEALLRALSSHSSHPLSRNLNSHFGAGPMPEMEAFEEISGKGIQAQFSNEEVKLGSADFVGEPRDEHRVSSARVYVKIRGQVKGYYSFSQPVREGLDEVLKSLANQYDLYLLSGDHSADKNRMGTYFKEDHMHFNCKPEEKLAFIESLQAKGKRVIMFGDGLNDAGALKQSDVGIAVSDDINNFSPACDAILSGHKMGQLSSYLHYAGGANKVILAAFVVSLIYNVIGLSYCVRGELEPIIAAIIMPTASISIVSFSTLASTLLSRKYFS